LADNEPGALPFDWNKIAIWLHVLYFGAHGNGKSDETAAINSAVNDGCGQGRGGSTILGAVVYLPPGEKFLCSFL
jgi:polygalacturonase